MFVSHFATTIFQRLRQVVQKTLEDNGIDSNHSFYEPCTERLYSLCKSFLKVSLLRSLVIASESLQNGLHHTCRNRLVLTMMSGKHCAQGFVVKLRHSSNRPTTPRANQGRTCGDGTAFSLPS